MKKKNSIMGMAFFGPALVLLTIFLFLPMVLTLVFSFTDYFALNPELTHFVGLENYLNIFKDELFVQSFLNTVKFVIIIVPCQCIGALAGAGHQQGGALQEVLQGGLLRAGGHVPGSCLHPVDADLQPGRHLKYAAGELRHRCPALYPQCQPGASLHRRHERMAGRRLPDDHLPGACRISTRPSMRRRRWTTPAAGSSSKISPCRN